VTPTLTVDLGERSYPIHIGSGILGRAELYRPHILGSQVMVVTNQTVAPLYLEPCRSALAAFDVRSVVLPDGERYKNLETLNRIFDALLENRFNRRCTLVALGGGVIGDMAGFAAASYQRGVPFIQVPTTLLSQVDSSVGGKTGVNHPLGKNMIGAFYQPRCVIADTASLDTLPDRELSAGLAEVIKYGVIRDPDFFAWLERHMGDLLRRDPAALAQAIERSCRNKSEVVAADEVETRSASGRCSISGIPSDMPSRPAWATARGCTGRPWPPACAWRRASPGASAGSTTPRKTGCAPSSAPPASPPTHLPRSPPGTSFG